MELLIVALVLFYRLSAVIENVSLRDRGRVARAARTRAGGEDNVSGERILSAFTYVSGCFVGGREPRWQIGRG